MLEGEGFEEESAGGVDSLGVGTPVGETEFGVLGVSGVRSRARERESERVEASKTGGSH